MISFHSDSLQVTCPFSIPSRSYLFPYVGALGYEITDSSNIVKRTGSFGYLCCRVEKKYSRIHFLLCGDCPLGPCWSRGRLRLPEYLHSCTFFGLHSPPTSAAGISTLAHVRMPTTHQQPVQFLMVPHAPLSTWLWKYSLVSRENLSRWNSQSMPPGSSFFYHSSGLISSGKMTAKKHGFTPHKEDSFFTHGNPLPSSSHRPCPLCALPGGGATYLIL